MSFFYYNILCTKCFHRCTNPKYPWTWGSLRGSVSIKSACSAGDLCLIPGYGRSPGERNGYPLQYSCLQNSMNRGAWKAAEAMGLQIVRHNWATNTNTFINIEVIRIFLSFYTINLPIQDYLPHNCISHMLIFYLITKIYLVESTINGHFYKCFYYCPHFDSYFLWFHYFLLTGSPVLTTSDWYNITM